MTVVVPSAATRTLGDLKARIADEIARADLTSQIGLAITDAIDEACTHRFWFMETRNLTIAVSAGVATYTSDDIANLLEIDRLKLVVGARTYTLPPISDDQLDRMTNGNLPMGQPYYYSRYTDTISLFPFPVQSYTVIIDGLTRGASLLSDTDSSIWTTQGEKYVRALAKRNLYADVLRNADEAQKFDSLALRYRQELEQQTHQRIATNQVLTFA